MNFKEKKMAESGFVNYCLPNTDYLPPTLHHFVPYITTSKYYRPSPLGEGDEGVAALSTNPKSISPRWV